ncbi:MAG: ATP-binding protein [Chloroflexi bacterium]|nr:ATP-binding protein [Chloroflexota bacterium]MBI3733570.1 ATP-binding protein [Chloroflexota bacterium]
MRRASRLWPFLERYSSLRGDLLTKSFDNFKPRPGLPSLLQALDASKKFAGEPKGWLLLSGRPGIGKSHLAAAIANRLIKSQTLVLFLNVPELLSFLRAGFAANQTDDPDFDKRLQTIKDFPVLILDDWGAHSDTPWADEQLYLILNYRTERVLPTVVTTNLPLQELEPRVRSRLMNRRIGQVIKISAPEEADYRLGADG